MATRRGRGEGSVTRRADGRWMARVDLGWQDGKRCRKTLYGRTKREVQGKLREAVQRLEHGLRPVPEQESVGAFMRRWLEFKQGQLRPRTYASSEHIVRAHLDPGLGRVWLAKLAPHDVAAMRFCAAERSGFSRCAIFPGKRTSGVHRIPGPNSQS